MESVDITIIGAGIVGLAIAERLSSKFKVVVLEKENSFGQHTSSRNSGVIHSGVYYEPGSLKAELCVRGNILLYDFLKNHNIGYKKCGKLILDFGNEPNRLSEIVERAQKNNVEFVPLFNSDVIKRMESTIKPASNGLFIPSTGIFDSHATMKRLAYLAESNGAMIAYKTKVLDIKPKQSEFSYFVSTDNGFMFNTKIVINAAGLWAPKIAEMNGGTYESQYCKGEYYKTTKIKNMNHLIYPLPPKNSLGIHTKMDLEGNISFGPSAFLVDKIDYKVDNKMKQIFYEDANKIMDIDIEDLTEDFSGIRPRVKNSNDFIIQEDGLGFINLVGIESPGLTCCLSIAEYVEKMI